MATLENWAALTLATQGKSAEPIRRLLSELRDYSLAECDLRNEARAMNKARPRLARQGIVVPRIVGELSGSEMLGPPAAVRSGVLQQGFNPVGALI